MSLDINRSRFRFVPVITTLLLAASLETRGAEVTLQDATLLAAFATQREQFCHGGAPKLQVPGSSRIAVGLSRLRTSEAISRGAYAFALHALDHPS